MLLGFLSASWPIKELFLNWPLEKIMDYAKNQRCDAVELCIWRGRYKQLDLDAIVSGNNRSIAIKKMVAERGLTIAALKMDAVISDACEPRKYCDYFKKAIKAATILDIPVVNTAAPKPLPGQSVQECWADFEQVLGEIVDFATEQDVKIAIEMHGHSLIYNIETTEEMFRRVPSKTLGLNYDPSHMVWQGIDYLEMITRFSDRIYSVHAKDTEILHDRLRIVGIHGQGWWRFRLPGWGDINWRKLITYLKKRAKFGGIIAIEHEDLLFRQEREEAIKRGLEYLRPLLI